MRRFEESEVGSRKSEVGIEIDRLHRTSDLRLPTSDSRLPHFIAAIAILLLFNGCVPFLHPLYTEDTLVMNPELEGTWIDEDNKDIWTFQKASENSYELIHKSSKTPAKFDARLVKLGRSVFLDLYPKEAKGGEFKDDLFTLHLVPAHTFSKIQIEGDRMIVAMIDPDWLGEKLSHGFYSISQEKISLSYETFGKDSDVLITAPTEAIQQLFLKFGEEEKAFGKPKKLRRKEKESAPAPVEAAAAEKPVIEIKPIKEEPNKEPEAVSPFEFHSNFWVNLHHFLYQQARISTEQSAPAYKLTPQQEKIWREAIDFYKNGPAKLDLLFNDEMITINNRLSELDSSAALKNSGLKPDLAATLEKAAPVYRANWWPDHDRTNRAWIEGLKPLLNKFDKTLIERLETAYHAKWPKSSIRVDVSFYSHQLGAYTTLDPVHITVSSFEKRNQGLSALEIIFHEASHALIGPVNDAIAKQSQARNKSVARDVWHALLFYTTGEIVKRALAEGSMGEYVPYAYNFGLYERARGWDNYRRLFELYWQPYLDGKTDFDSALSKIIDAL